MAQTVLQRVVHLIASRYNVGNDAAPAHHGRQGGQVKALLGQPKPHQGHPVIQLVVQGVIRSQILIGMHHAFHRQLVLILINRRLGAGGTWVEY